MKNIKKLYQNEFDKITDDSNIYENTLLSINNKYIKRNKLRRIYFSISSIFVVILVGISIAYAQEITETLKSIFLRDEIKIKDNGDKFKVSNIMNKEHVEINQNIELKRPECHITRGYKGPDINDPCFSFYSIDELNKMLNIKLIKSKLDKKNKVFLWNAVKNDNDKYTSLSFTSFDMYNDFDTEDTNVPRVFEDIFISTNYDDEERIIISYNDNVKIEEIYIDSLNTNGFLVKGDKSRKIYFVFNKITYVFTVCLIGRDIDDLDEEVDKLIQSFAY